MKISANSDVPGDIFEYLDDHGGMLDELVHDVKSKEASVINTYGLTDQLDFLMGAYFDSWEELREWLDSVDGMWSFHYDDSKD